MEKFWISVTHGMRGYFAVMMVEEADGFVDVQQSGIGSYETMEEAEREGREWAKAEELEFRH